MKKWTLAFLLLLLVLALLGSTTTAQDTSDPEEPETFIPTEKLSADAAVSFPVDI